MNYFICIISDQEDSNGKTIPGLDIFSQLMEKKAWGLHPSTAAKAAMSVGDSIVFYLSGKRQVFLGRATVSSVPYLDKSGESDEWFLNKGTHRVDLGNVEVWSQAKPIKPLLNKLVFIKNVQFWGVFLKGGIRKIDLADFSIIVSSEDYSEIIEGYQQSLSELLNKSDLTTFDVEPHTLPAPERIKIFEIIDNVEQKWKIPNFQRYFDWKKEDIRSFVQSIFNDYYVGAFLLWKANKELPLELMPINGVDGKIAETDYIILDGQQRMTALYYVVKSPEFLLKGSAKKCYFYIDFKKFFQEENSEDLVVVRDELLDEIETFESLLFPFIEIEKYDEWINRLEDYLIEGGTISVDKIRSLRRIIEKRLKHIWRGFEIPYVVLPKTMGLPQVADIFEKINSTGKQLSTFDLLIARLLKYNVQLRNLWNDIEESDSVINKYLDNNSKTQMYIFQTMSLLNHPSSSVKKRDILNIYDSLSFSSSEEFDTAWHQSVVDIQSAINMLENLREGFGVRSKGDVPFTSVIPVLAALISVAGKNENKVDAYKKIKQWYWSAVFTNAYSSGADSQMTADFIDVNLWITDDTQVPRTVLNARREIYALDLQSIVSKGNAIYKGVMSLIALKGANDFENDLSLEFSPENDKDHIFPKAVYRGEKDAESVLNMTWLSKQTNIRKNAKKPSIYLPEFIIKKYNKDTEEFLRVLDTHFIDEAAYRYLLDDDFNNFILHRYKLIVRKIRQLIGVKKSTEEAIEENPGEALDELEEKIREFIDVKFKAKHGDDYWQVAATQGIKGKVRDKLSQRAQHHPITAQTKPSCIELMGYLDVMDYAELISSNWSDYESNFGSKREVEKHFLHLKDYRNSIKHNRSMNNVERKQGEASFEWIHDIVFNDVDDRDDI